MIGRRLEEQRKTLIAAHVGVAEPEGFGVLRHPPMESRTPNPNPRVKNPRSYSQSGFGEFDDNPNPSSLMLHEILDYIEGNRVTSYRALVQYARQCRPEWKRTIRANSNRVTRFIKTRSRNVQG